MEDSEEYLQWPGVDAVWLRADGLFYGSAVWAQTYLASAARVIETITKSDSIRLIVLETWLLVDDMIRQLLMTGLDLNKHENDDLELRYNLLPRSFVGCLELLDKLRNVNAKLPVEPVRYDFTMPVQLASHFIKKHRSLFEQVQKVVEEFREAKYPELKKLKEEGRVYLFMPQPEKQYRTVPTAWLEAVNKIDKSWMTKARQVNSARNKAAHTHNEFEIAKSFGLSSSVDVETVKTVCLDVIDQLLGIIPSQPDHGN